jgi:GPH family glycoside/pentoside/hexuronide:cation symporter
MENKVKYSLFAFPLAFIGIPIYIYLPQFLNEIYGLNIGIIGLILFFSRILDAFYDPYLGFISDKYGLTNKSFIVLISLLLGIFFNLFFYMPYNVTLLYKYIYFSLITITVYFLFSLAYVNYYNIGLFITDITQSKLSSKRESVLFLGILFASSFPSLIRQFLSNEIDIFRIYGIVFFLVIICSAVFLPKVKANRITHEKSSFLEIIPTYWTNKSAKYILILFFLNSIPVAITSNLLIFYIDIVLKSKQALGSFLIAYFLFAAIGSIIFGFLSKFIERFRILLYSMILASVAFFFTIFIDSQNRDYFYLISIISGFALGLEMPIITSIASDIIKNNFKYSNSFFGIWTSISKISLAFAAGIFLPIISNIDNIFPTISVEFKIITLYAIIPLLIKFIVIIFTYNVSKKMGIT